MIYDQKLETHLLSGLLRKPSEYLTIQPFFSEADIYSEDSILRRSIFSLIKQAVEKGEDVDATIIAQRLEGLGIKFDEEMSVGQYVESIALRQVAEGAVYKAAVELKKISKRRKLIGAMGDAIKELQKLDRSSSIVDIEKIVDKHITSEMGETENGEEEAVNIYDSMQEFIETDPETSDELLGPFDKVNQIYGSLVNPGNIVTITSRSGVGKMQPLYSKVLTPFGWKTMGEIKKGDTVMSRELKPIRVLNTFDHEKKDVYRLYFQDGRTVDCGEEHLWKAWARSYKNKKNGAYDWQVLDTKEIIRRLSLSRDMVYVPLVQPVQEADINLPIDPYVLGVILGDGTTRGGQVAIESADESLIERCRSLMGEDFFVKKVRAKNSISKSSSYRIHSSKTYRKRKSDLNISLEELNLQNKFSYEKFIPDIYLEASFSQKIELIKGLMDTDGTLSNGGALEFASSSLMLAKQVQKIIWSIGGIARIAEKKPFYYDKNRNKILCRTCYRVHIRYRNPKDLFWLSRKKAKVSNDYQYKNLKLKILKIEKLSAKEDCRCLEVSGDEKLYITDDFVVTHNTSLAMEYCSYIGKKHGITVLHFDNGEMSLQELQQRQVAMHSGVPMHLLRKQKWRRAGPEIVAKVRKVWDDIKKGKIKFFYKSVAGMSADEMISYAKKFYYSHAGRGNKMLISFDYIKTTSQLGGNLTEWQVVGEIVDKFKKFVQSDIVFDKKPMIGMFTSVQSNRSGITNNKSADDIVDNESTVSLSDRIIQFSSHMFILRKKTMDEILEEGTEFGTHKFICIKARHLGEDTMGHLEPVKIGDKLKQNFINLDFKNFTITECGDLRDIVKKKSQFGNLHKSQPQSDATDF